MPTVDVIEAHNGSRIAVCGAWILVRLFPDGQVREVMTDAPDEMMQAAYDALGIPRERG